MKQTFWEERWSVNRIGFHQSEINHWLQKFHHLLTPESSRCLVPLCGKSKDMLWLAEQGHRVVGVEFVAKAVEEFFADNAMEAQSVERGAHSVISAANIELWNADIFSVGSAELGAFEAVFDRAALIALPPETRTRYAQHVVSLMAAGGRALVTTLAYDQSRLDGPPFSVSQDEVRSHFSLHGELEVLHSEHTDDIPPKFKEVGLPTVELTVWLFTRSSQ